MGMALKIKNTDQINIPELIKIKNHLLFLLHQHFQFKYYQDIDR
jgi:hypothetical protein